MCPACIVWPSSNSIRITSHLAGHTFLQQVRLLVFGTPSHLLPLPELALRVTAAELRRLMRIHSAVCTAAVAGPRDSSTRHHQRGWDHCSSRGGTAAAAAARTCMHRTCCATRQDHTCRHITPAEALWLHHHCCSELDGRAPPTVYPLLHSCSGIMHQRGRG